jgi:uncharacterized protein with HEPN domain
VDPADNERAEAILAAAEQVAGVVAGGEEELQRSSDRQRELGELLELIGAAAATMGEEGRGNRPDVDWAAAARLAEPVAGDTGRLWQRASVEVPELARQIATQA